MDDTQFQKIKSVDGFVAALDQSGGSTPNALALYGIPEGSYSSDEEMFNLVHEMRTRIITSSKFNGDRVLAAILFEDTMNRQIEGRPSPAYLWEVKQIVPFVKVDQGLEAEANGAQVMKPMPDLEDLLARARDLGIFGTKMRSVIKLANPDGVSAVVRQQFDVGIQILEAGLIPIIEPEIDIHSPEKAAAEAFTKQAILDQLERVGEDQSIMLKLTLPETNGFYQELVDHPKVLRVVALSGGYSREEANARLAANPGVIASFSRAFTEGLNVQQSAEEFDAVMDSSIQSIFEASKT